MSAVVGVGVGVGAGAVADAAGVIIVDGGAGAGRQESRWKLMAQHEVRDEQASPQGQQSPGPVGRGKCGCCWYGCW